MNLDLVDPAVSALMEARSALETQLTALTYALHRLEHARSLLPATIGGERWRGPANGAYRASIADLAAHLDDAIATVSLARNSTNRALASIAARVG